MKIPAYENERERDAVRHYVTFTGRIEIGNGTLLGGLGRITQEALNLRFRVQSEKGDPTNAQLAKWFETAFH